MKLTSCDSEHYVWYAWNHFFQLLIQVINKLPYFCELPCRSIYVRINQWSWDHPTLRYFFCLFNNKKKKRIHISITTLNSNHKRSCSRAVVSVLCYMLRSWFRTSGLPILFFFFFFPTGDLGADSVVRITQTDRWPSAHGYVCC